MAERAYTVGEIDDLRSVVENKWLYGSYSGGNGWSRYYKTEEKEIAVEERVRTHMLAGHTADDLRASDRAKASDDAPFERVGKGQRPG